MAAPAPRGVAKGWFVCAKTALGSFEQHAFDFCLKPCVCSVLTVYVHSSALLVFRQNRELLLNMLQILA